MADDHGRCPSCDMDFNGGLIWEHFYNEFITKGYWRDENGNYTIDRRILTHEEAELTADTVSEGYGANRTQGRWGLQIGISDWDSVYAWTCPGCKHSWDRYGWKDGKRSYDGTSDPTATSC